MVIILHDKAHLIKVQ